jgi:hypothetical protein
MGQHLARKKHPAHNDGGGGDRVAESFDACDRDYVDNDDDDNHNVSTGVWIVNRLPDDLILYGILPYMGIDDVLDAAASTTTTWNLLARQHLVRWARRIPLECRSTAYSEIQTLVVEDATAQEPFGVQSYTLSTPEDFVLEPEIDEDLLKVACYVSMAHPITDRLSGWWVQGLMVLDQEKVVTCSGLVQGEFAKEYVRLCKLYVAPAHMTCFWSSAVDRLAWVTHVVLQIDAQRTVWDTLFAFYEEHGREPDDFSAAEMMYLALMCLASTSDSTWQQWMAHVHTYKERMAASNQIPLVCWRKDSFMTGATWCKWLSAFLCQRPLFVAVVNINNSSEFVFCGLSFILNRYRQHAVMRAQSARKIQLEHALAARDLANRPNLDVCEHFIHQTHWTCDTGFPCIPTLEQTVQIVADTHFLDTHTDYYARITQARQSQRKHGSKQKRHTLTLAVRNRCKLDALTACLYSSDLYTQTQAQAILARLEAY